jgi:hypothetical protein
MLSVQDILDLEKLKDKAEAAYVLYHEKSEELNKKAKGETLAFPVKPDADGNKWIRVTFVDNIKKLENGETVVGISIVRPLHVKLDRLKNQPKL